MCETLKIEFDHFSTEHLDLRWFKSSCQCYSMLEKRSIVFGVPSNQNGKVGFETVGWNKVHLNLVLKRGTTEPIDI